MIVKIVQRCLAPTPLFTCHALALAKLFMYVVWCWCRTIVSIIFLDHSICQVSYYSSRRVRCLFPMDPGPAPSNPIGIGAPPLLLGLLDRVPFGVSFLAQNSFL